ncbi:hypothetical protein ACPCSB_04715 [Streptomyces pseudogriseolus]|uniref:hypothetical protein n=1 Tax=Streptomyces pseudogriseolus TaxID=36817 RepID=UPI003FA2AFF0
MSKRPPNVLEEPEPVRRAWAKIRAELGINVLHHDRQRVFDIVAHEIAEQIRQVVKDCPWGPCQACEIRLGDADLIDPEVQR